MLYGTPASTHDWARAMTSALLMLPPAEESAVDVAKAPTGLGAAANCAAEAVVGLATVGVKWVSKPEFAVLDAAADGAGVSATACSSVMAVTAPTTATTG
jgi:hypothetical protein